MGVIVDKNSRLVEHVRACLEDDDARRDTYQAQAAFERCRKAQGMASQAWEACRAEAAALRDEVLSHLTAYWQQFAHHAAGVGMTVVEAESVETAQAVLMDVCRKKGATEVVMAAGALAEEIEASRVMAAGGVNVGVCADVAIVEGRFVISGSGALCLTQEAYHAYKAAKSVVVLVALESVLPDEAALETIKQAAGCSPLETVWMVGGTSADSERKEICVVAVDHRRSRVLGSGYQDILRCVRCGACQNTCPVVRHISGDGYGTCYSGPMGIVYTPILNGWDDYTKDLPFVCTLCGACAEVCPVKIPLTDLIMTGRRDVVENTDLQNVKEDAFYRVSDYVLSHPLAYRLSLAVAKPLMRGVARLTMEDNHLGDNIKLPLLHYWTGCRNMPLLRSGEFRWWFEEHHRFPRH